VMFDLFVGLAIAAGLVIYLVIALIWPQKF
jgi:K+-transporting ATPase KdpF subunit